MGSKLNQIGENELDVFRELGNIGSGNAVTALAGMLDKQIRMSVPEAQIVPFNHIINMLNGPENLVVGVLIDMSGDLNGYVLLVLEMRDACEIASLATGNPMPIGPLAADCLNELEQSAITEVANIVVGSYLSAVSSMTGLRIRPSVPQMAIDMMGAIISIVLIEYGKIGDSVLFLKTQFSDINKKLNGHFFLIPNFESYEILIRSLGIK